VHSAARSFCLFAETQQQKQSFKLSAATVEDVTHLHNMRIATSPMRRAVAVKFSHVSDTKRLPGGIGVTVDVTNC
jgi:CHAD domain-containing protein